MNAIQDIQKWLGESGIDALVLYNSDPHESEYIAPRYCSIAWLSGFKGENAKMVITPSRCALWTDPRYQIQVESDLQGTPIEVFMERVPDAVSIPAFLESIEAQTIAIDSLTTSVSSALELRKVTSEELICLPDLINRFWKDRPAMPCKDIFEADVKYMGETRAERLEWLRAGMEADGTDFTLISELSEIAWLLNIRSSEIDYNPLAMAHLMVSLDDAYLFIRKIGQAHSGMVTAATFAALEQDGVSVYDYEEASSVISTIVTSPAAAKESFRLDPSTTNFEIYRIFTSNLPSENIVCKGSPLTMKKACKNPAEMEAMRKAHFEDGLAMEQFLFWLDNHTGCGATEYDAMKVLDGLRAAIPGYHSLSFETISAYGPSAALPHYMTPEEGSRVLEPCGLYLVDSGGQYDFGTTDITRTVPLGECSEEEMTDYTLVLKAHIRAEMAVLPEGSCGMQLDAIARSCMWSAKKNFSHGLGHGVGMFLGVHEAPPNIRSRYIPEPFLPGMIFSDEPGLYVKDSHGIRHENMLLCLDAGSSDFGNFVRFEPMTLCHFDTRAIAPGILTQDEIDWLNDYNAHVYETLRDSLPEDVAEWLYEMTQPVQ